MYGRYVMALYGRYLIACMVGRDGMCGRHVMACMVST